MVAPANHAPDAFRSARRYLHWTSGPGARARDARAAAQGLSARAPRGILVLLGAPAGDAPRAGLPVRARTDLPGIRRSHRVARHGEDGRTGHGQRRLARAIVVAAEQE